MSEVTALLIETRALNDEKLDIQIKQIEELLKEFEVKERFILQKMKKNILFIGK